VSNDVCDETGADDSEAKGRGHGEILGRTGPTLDRSCSQIKAHRFEDVLSIGAEIIRG
jgi:hypothetical protein